MRTQGTRKHLSWARGLCKIKPTRLVEVTGALYVIPSNENKEDWSTNSETIKIKTNKWKTMCTRLACLTGSWLNCRFHYRGVSSRNLKGSLHYSTAEWAGEKWILTEFIRFLIINFKTVLPVVVHISCDETWNRMHSFGTNNYRMINLSTAFNTIFR